MEVKLENIMYIFNKIGYKPKAQPTQKELSEAQNALKSLKMKMAAAPKKPAPKPQSNNNRFVPTFDIEEQMMNQGMGMNYGGQMGGYGGGYGGQMNNMYGGNTGNMRSVPQKAVNKPAAKKPVNNNFGGGFNNNFKGGYSGGGMMDNRPIGGGMDMGMNPEEGEPTSPCPHCGRSFVATALAKHTKICQKVFQKKRKAFNTQKQRMIDGEHASLMKQGQMMEKKNAKLNPKNKGGIPKWKLQSMEFRQICRGGEPPKIGKGGLSSKGGKGNIQQSYTPSVITDSFIPCKFCNRRYNDEADHKHLPGCERRYKEAQMINKLQKKPAGNSMNVKRGGVRGKK